MGICQESSDECGRGEDRWQEEKRWWGESATTTTNLWWSNHWEPISKIHVGIFSKRPPSLTATCQRGHQVHVSGENSGNWMTRLRQHEWGGPFMLPQPCQRQRSNQLWTELITKLSLWAQLQLLIMTKRKPSKMKESCQLLGQSYLRKKSEINCTKRPAAVSGCDAA